MGLQSRRVGNEWDLLLHLQRSNPSILQAVNRNSSPEVDAFLLVLLRTGGIVSQNGREILVYSHEAKISFPRFFPSVPLEARLAVPVFHPNVDPVSGFVCLWNRFAPGDTVIEAVCRLQRVISWKLLNLDQDQVIQPRAVVWYEDPNRAQPLPLAFEALVWPDECGLEHESRIASSARRRRLEPIGR